MKTRFTAEQFLEIFKRYNQAVWPMQIVLYLVSFMAIYLAFKPTSNSDNVIIGLLSFIFVSKCFKQ